MMPWTAVFSFSPRIVLKICRHTDIGATVRAGYGCQRRKPSPCGPQLLGNSQLCLCHTSQSFCEHVRAAHLGLGDRSWEVDVLDGNPYFGASFDFHADVDG